jgi:hypothetical protein
MITDDGSNNLTGAEFAFQVLDPTGAITATTVNLKPANGVYTGVPSTQFALQTGPVVRPGEFSEAFRQVITNDQENPDDPDGPPIPTFAHVNGTQILATATIKITNPLPGVYPILIDRTTITPYVTKIADDSRDDAQVNGVVYVNGSITVVPEPSTILMAGVAGLGLVFYGFRRNRSAA